MKQEMEILQPGMFYHIYNRGINSENLFLDAEHYERFMHLYSRFIEPIAETFAWVLMPNHFHFLLRIKENRVYKYSKINESLNEDDFNNLKWETMELSIENKTEEHKTPIPHNHFSHFFNAYTHYFNTRTNRHGGLFEGRYKRKSVNNNIYLKNVVLYIHHNPVHHGFCEHPVEYPWSSYLTCVSAKPTRLARKEVVGWFDNEANFKITHNAEIDTTTIEKWLEI